MNRKNHHFLPEDQFQDLLSRFVKRQCTPEEEQLVRDWYASLGDEDEINISDEQLDIIEERLWSSLHSKRRSAKIRVLQTDISYKQLRRITGIAASITIVIAAFFYFLSGPLLPATGERIVVLPEAEMAHYIINTDTTPKKVALADGSAITLQPGSAVRYGDLHQGNTRQVSLTGDAFFEVASDKQRPFFVFSGAVVTKVLGTSFSIEHKKAGEAIDVVVKTGRVSVSRIENTFADKVDLANEVIVTPNHKATYTKADEKVVASVVDDPRLLDAQKNKIFMTFDEAPVVDILHALEDAYGVNIVFDEEKMSTCILTTELTEESLYDRLNIICKAIGGAYALQGTDIVVSGNGCGIYKIN